MGQFESCCGSSYFPPEAYPDPLRDLPRRQLHLVKDGCSKLHVHEGLDCPAPKAATYVEETILAPLGVEQAAEASPDFQEAAAQDVGMQEEQETQSFVMWTADGEELVSFYIVDPGGPEETVATIAVPEGCAQKLNPKVLLSDSELAEVQGQLEDSQAGAAVLVELLEVPVQVSAPSRIPFSHPWQPGMVTYNFMSGAEIANPCLDSMRSALQELREARAQVTQQQSKSTLGGLDDHDVMCPNQHKLKVRQASYASAWNCDSCKRRNTFNGSIRCQCRRCNYDLCRYCFASLADVDPGSLTDLIRTQSPPVMSQVLSKTIANVSKKSLLDAVMWHNPKIATS